MKKYLLSLLSLFLLSLSVSAQNPTVQVIHNVPDTTLDTIDVWLDDTMLVDDLAYRHASSFIEVLAGVPFDLTIQPANSTDTVNGRYRESFTLLAGQNDVLVMDGIDTGSTGYTPSPALDFHEFLNGQMNTSGGTDTTDLLFYHGSTDAPTLDFYESDSLMATVGNDLSYSGFEGGGYQKFGTANITFQVRDQYNSHIMNAYSANLVSWNLHDSAAVILASGFMDTTANNNGPSFGLWAAPAGGGQLIELPMTSIPMARAQFVHNAADTLLDTVDIWLNDTLLGDDIPFRHSTDFMDFQAGVPFDITVKADTSTDTTNALYRTSMPMTTDDTAVVVGMGIISGSGYTPSTPFSFNMMSNARESADNGSGNTDVLFFNGVTDDPAIDIIDIDMGGDTLADDLASGSFGTYQELSTMDRSFQSQEMNNTDVYAQYEAALQSLGLDGAAITVMTSGFADTSNNEGAIKKLYATQPGGGAMVEFPEEMITPAPTQIIVNEPSTDTFDIWVNDSLYPSLDNIAFRQASPYLELEAGLTDISILPKNSTDTTSALYRKTYTFHSYDTTVIVGDGLIDPTGYNPATNFAFYEYEKGRKTANTNGSTDILFHHGTTDGPIVNLHETAVLTTQLDTGRDYAEFAPGGYWELMAQDLTFLLQDSTTGSVIESYDAPFNSWGYDDSAFVMLVSGFADSTMNNNGPGIGLWVALPGGGDLVKLPEVPRSQAQMQFIHNSADTLVDTVDVWVNDTLFADDLPFRSATAFGTIDAGLSFDLTLQPANSTDTTSALYRESITPGDDDTLIAVSSGIMSGSGYSPAPSFNVHIYDMGRTQASDPSKMNVSFFHGSTDTQSPVDIYESSVTNTTLADNLGYGQFNAYQEIDTAEFVWEVRNQNNSQTLKTYRAPLDSAAFDSTTAGLVLTSGFMDTASNSGGAIFGLWMAPQHGGPLIELPEKAIDMAKAQFIHNSPDQNNVDQVDIWINDNRIADDLNFRYSTSFLNTQAGVPMDVTITHHTSTDTSMNVLMRMKDTMLQKDKNYIFVLDGILGSYPSPALDLYVYDEAKLSASNDQVRLLFHHGSTDGPKLEAYRHLGSGLLSSGLDYSDFSNGYSLLNGSKDHFIDLTYLNGSPLYRSYEFPANTNNLGDSAITLVISGFEDPSSNNNGPAFGLWYTGTQGGALTQLVDKTSIEENKGNEAVSIYPNPASEKAQLTYELSRAEDNVRFRVFDLLGHELLNQDLGMKGSGLHRETIDLQELSEGVYYVKFSTDNFTTTRKLQVTGNER